MLYLLKGELQHANVSVREGLRKVGRLQRDSVYCPDPEMERPKPLLSLKPGRTVLVQSVGAYTLQRNTRINRHDS